MFHVPGIPRGCSGPLVGNLTDLPALADVSVTSAAPDANTPFSGSNDSIGVAALDAASRTLPIPPTTAIHESKSTVFFILISVNILT
jgi:hypothetical protein